MLIKDQLVETTWNSTTKKYYMEKGYKYTKIGDSFFVKLEDLPLNSHSKIDIICDFCGDKFQKTYPEIREKINMSYYKNNSQKVSKPQLEIYNMLKGIYEKCELNYPCSRCSLDCMIVVNGIKIDVEYDAPYWHKDKEKDRRRDEFIKSCGYKILRIKGNTTIPTLKDIVDKIDILINTDKKYEKIQLV